MPNLDLNVNTNQKTINASTTASTASLNLKTSTPQVDLTEILEAIDQLQSTLGDLEDRLATVENPTLEPYTQVDISNEFIDVFTSTPMSLGTGGFAAMRYTIVGNTCMGMINGIIAPDAPSAGLNKIGLPASVLPSPAPFPLVSTPVGFAYFAAGESEPGAGDGILEPSGGIFMPVGDPPPLGFVNLSRNNQNAGDGNVLGIDYPTDFSGRSVIIVAQFMYEIAVE